MTDQVPPDQKPFAISFHISGEFLTVTLLVVSGLGSWLNKGWVKLLSSTAFGLILYTVIVSPGYYAQLGDFAMVGMSMVLTVLTVVALIFN